MLEVLKNKYKPISLKELDKVKLLNRTDTKFVLDFKTLEKVLNECSAFYDVLTINGKNTNDYRTLYFDLPDFGLYNKHHRGFGDRHKVRIRKYLDSDLCFLEIKHKYKGRTDKSRIRIEDFEEQLSSDSLNYINKNSVLKAEDLNHTLYNQFTRITLAHKTDQERVTIDLNLSFEHKDKSKSFDQLVIAEIKQERVNLQSSIIQSLKRHGVRVDRISKYCFGAILLYPELKYNNFKTKIQKIAKLHDTTFEHLRRL